MRCGARPKISYFSECQRARALYSNLTRCLLTPLLPPPTACVCARREREGGDHALNCAYDYTHPMWTTPRPKTSLLSHSSSLLRSHAPSCSLLRDVLHRPKREHSLCTAVAQWFDSMLDVRKVRVRTSSVFTFVCKQTTPKKGITLFTNKCVNLRGG